MRQVAAASHDPFSVWNVLVLTKIQYLTLHSSSCKIGYKGGDDMNAQLKKGVLELIVLESVRQKDMYGYELVEEVSKVVDVNEGTIYPLLKRLTNEKYFSLSKNICVTI